MTDNRTCLCGQRSNFMFLWYNYNQYSSEYSLEERVNKLNICSTVVSTISAHTWTTYSEKADFADWTCLPYGPQAHTTASTVLAGTRIQERTRSTKS